MKMGQYYTFFYRQHITTFEILTLPVFVLEQNNLCSKVLAKQRFV